jgi:transcriptional regulator GlxA family with amidase domain
MAENDGTMSLRPNAGRVNLTTLTPSDDIMTRTQLGKARRQEAHLQAFLADGPHVIGVLIYPGCSAYDVAATAEVFSTANGQLRRERGVNADAYEVQVISTVPGPVVLEMGLKIMPDRTTSQTCPKLDTLFLSGGCWEPVEAAVADPALVSWIKRAADKSARIASMCTGAFLLAEAGLAPQTVTTHWAQCDHLRQKYPALNVNADQIYIKHNNIYSSAGGTAAMDLALALVEEDLGRKLAMNVARRLVMFLKRPGGQSQFSTALLGQTTASDALSDVTDWIIDHLDEDLSVDALAQRAHMSPRNFARVFSAETGLTPAKFVERARLERARQLIEDTGLSLLTVASRSGFESDQHLRRTFMRWLGVTPANYVARFRSSSRPAPTNRRTAEPPQPWLP